MCNSLQLTTGERYRIDQQDKSFIVSGYERRHFAYPGRLYGFRRIERIRLNGVIDRIRGITNSERPLSIQPTAFGYLQTQIGSIEGVYEQDTYVPIPDSYQLTAVVIESGLYMVTVGEDFVKSLVKVKPNVESIPFYEQVLSNHPGVPRSPLVLGKV